MRKHRTTARPGSPDRFERPKILVQDIGKHLVATLDDGHFYVKDALMLHQKQNGLSLKFILALVNSKLLNYWYAEKFSTLSVAKNAVLILPIRRIDFNDAAEKAAHDRLVALAEHMMELHKQLQALSPLEAEQRHSLQRETDRTDAEIDSLVYDLYGLTEAERQIVEAELGG